MKLLLSTLLVSGFLHVTAHGAPSCFAEAAERPARDSAERRALAHSKSTAPPDCKKSAVQCKFDVSRMHDEGILVEVRVAVLEGKPPKCLYPLDVGPLNAYDKTGRYVRTMPNG